MRMIGRIFKEGILASLSGGFYVDPSQEHFIWIVHIFLWLLFFTIPVTITTLVPTSVIAWISYTCTVTFVVTCILFLTHWLHKEFDKYEPVFITNGVNILMTEQENHSQSSKEMHCETVVRPNPSSEEIEEQCRRIGMAGLYIADLNPQSGTSFAYANPNIPHLEHQDSSAQGRKSDFHKATPASNASRSFHQQSRASNLPESAISTDAGEASSSFPTRSLPRHQSDPAETFLSRIDACRVGEVPRSLPEIEVSRLHFAPSPIPESSATAFREHFRRYVHRFTSDVNALRSRSSSSRLSIQNPPRSIRFRRSWSSHNWRRFRHSPLRSRTLPQHPDRNNCPRSGGDLSTCSYDLRETVGADKEGDIGVLKPPPDADTDGYTENSPLLSNRVSSPIDKIDNKATVGVSVRAHYSESSNVPQPTNAVTAAVRSAGALATVDTRDSSCEDLCPLSLLTSPLPSSSVSSAAAQVHFDTVRLRQRTFSSGRRRLQVSRRRRAIYVSNYSSRRCHVTQTSEEFLPSPSTSRPSIEAREVEEGTRAGVERDGQGRALCVGVIVGRRNRCARHKSLFSHPRLPAFPPGVNSLDHAYSSPIRNNLLPRSDADVIRNGENSISATAGMSDRNSLLEAAVPTAPVSTVQFLEAPVPSDRTLSLELQSGSIPRGLQQSASSTSIYELAKEPSEEGRRHRPRSLSPSSMHPCTFCAKNSPKRSDGDSIECGRATSLELKAPSNESGSKGDQQPSLSVSMYRLVREPPRPPSSGHSNRTLLTSNNANDNNTYASAFEWTSVAVSQSSRVATTDTSGNATAAAATALSAADTSVVALASGSNGSGGGGFASSVGGLSATTSGEVVTDTASSSALPAAFRFSTHRPRVGQSGMRGGGRRRQCTIAYRVRLFPFWRRRFLIKFDRLQLSALFDPKPTWPEVCATLVLTTLVSVLSGLLLFSGAFHDFSLPVFCCVIAGCHYSLIKSVQPDPASPRHGFNRLIVYSRSLVFCLLTGLFALSLLFIPSADRINDSRHTIADICPANFHFVRRRASTWLSDGIMTGHLSSSPPLVLYRWRLEALWVVCLLKDVCGYLLLAFPLILLFGLVPQANTLVSNVLEQVDMHVFGASGSVNLSSVVVSVGRSCAVIGLGFGFCYAAVVNCNPQDGFFSSFWGLYLALCFLLSRTPNDVGIVRLLFIHITATNNINKSLPSTSPLSRLHYLLRRVSWCLQNLFVVRTSLESSHHRRQQHQKQQSRKRGMVTSLTSCDRKSGDEECETASRFLAASRQQGRQSQLALWPMEVCGGTERSLSSQLSSTPTPPPLPRTTTPESLVLSPFDGGLADDDFMTVACESGSCRQSLGSAHSTSNLQLPLSHCRRASSSILSPVPEGVASPPSAAPLFSAAAGIDTSSSSSDIHDPLPGRTVAAMLIRIRNDFLLIIIWAILGFAVHVSTVFTVPTLQPTLPRLLTWLLIVWGFALHYVWPQLRKPFPWLLLAHPVCPPAADGRVTALEIVYHWCHWLEKYFLVPAVTMATATKALIPLAAKFGNVGATLILLVTSMKLLRHGFSGATRMFLNFFFAEVLFTCDFPGLSETFPVDYFFVSIILTKVAELWSKLSFVYIYIAPFQASWGSICHAVAQLASIPHFISTLGNCIFSTVLSAPLEPFVASVFFITSYTRPIRFWEATQKIHRIESTNTSLFSQLRGVSFEQVTANLNAIFYEHIARCLQQRLAGDIALGRWSSSNVQAGDIFILASEELHFLLHIIEVGNGLVTFQIRGLEFAGTYCHEQESNGLSEPHLGGRDFCCCTLRRLPAALLSPNSAIRLRWLAWQFVHTPYTIEGYRLIDHSAATSLQVIDFRKIVLALFIQCLLYFTARLPNLSGRLQLFSAELTERFVGENKADLDPVFSKIFDEDFDESVSGVTRAAFIRVYAEWIRYCLSKCPENKSVDASDESDLMTLCYAVSLLGRRCLGGVSGHLNNALETFLHYLHDVFKGDVQISAKDDWVFADVELLRVVVTPAMRVALKLYQDHFTWNPLSTNRELYRAIWSTTQTVVICHETDPQWRSAVLNDAERLFSFRRIDSGTTQQCFRFIMMNKQILSFQVIKLNSECVRGFWAGQLREQIFLRNNNAERGSIQHAKHVLRNLINSSCDQPVGYPIYVSPLITSFVESHLQYRKIACPNLSIPGLVRSLWSLQDRIKQYCRRSYRCGGGGGSSDVELHRLQSSKFSIQRSAYQQRKHHRHPCHQYHHHHPFSATPHHHQLRLCHLSNPHPRMRQQGGGVDRGSTTSSLLLAAGGSELATWCAEVVANVGATTTTGSPLPLPPSSRASSVPGLTVSGATNTTLSAAVVHHADSACQRVRIVDPSQILNDRLLKLEWPSHSLLAKCLPQSACPLSSLMGAEGILVHRWTPSNIDPCKRSFCHRNIALITFPEGPITLEGHYVAIWEDLGLEYIPPLNA
ncbi:Pecanex-like protein 1 [Echinococcus granulosus]|nr:Pecanex-like protein 1 [Echinococcus granulosus]